MRDSWHTAFQDSQAITFWPIFSHLLICLTQSSCIFLRQDKSRQISNKFVSHVLWLLHTGLKYYSNQWEKNDMDISDSIKESIHTSNVSVYITSEIKYAKKNTVTY